MLQRLTAPLPDWARPTHPIMRYTLQRGVRQRAPLQRVLIRAMALLIVGGLLLSSEAMVEQGEPLLTGFPLAHRLATLLYFPLAVLQYVALMMAALLTLQAMSGELARGTWDDILLTSHGAAMVFRTRWAAVFYQLRWLLAAVIVPRLIFAALLVIDIAESRGGTLDQQVDGITPAVSPLGAVLLLAVQVTASVIQVPVLVGLVAAAGLATAAVIRSPLILTLVRIAVPVGLLILLSTGLSRGAELLNTHPLSTTFAALDMRARWSNLLWLNLIGDQGLRVMDLDTLLRTWIDVDYAVLMGALMLSIVLVEAALADRLMRFAAWIAARPGRE